MPWQGDALPLSYSRFEQGRFKGSCQASVVNAFSKATNGAMREGIAQ
jgi:hypothetical protein